MNDREIDRRAWLGRLTRGLSPQAQTPAPATPPSRITTAGSARVPRTELVNVLEFETEARRMLPAATFASIAGSDRSAFDRVTIHPRVMVPTTNLDLTLQLFGAAHFAPILVAPLANPERFHASGAVGVAQGATAAQAAMIVSARTPTKVEDVVAAAKLAPWFQVFDSDATATADAARAIAAGCKVLVVTTGLRVSDRGAATVAPADWTAVGRLVATAKVPAVVKGIRTPQDAETAIARGAAGIIATDYAQPASAGSQPLLFNLPAIVDRVKGRVPVLADGNFRRGTDIVKALALGATAVTVGRPVLWGLSAYGSDGVQGVLEMLQTELARYLAMSGRPNLASLDRTVVRIHSR